MVLYSHAWYLGASGPERFAAWLFHAAEFPGGIGVKGFFVLSGFLVMRSERRLSGPREFLWHRGLRIFPGLWCCLMVTALVFPWMKQLVQPSTVIDWSDAGRYVWRNWFQPRSQLSVAGLLTRAANNGDLNGSLWTLPFEIGCYAMLAFAGWLGLTRGRARGAWMAGAALFVLYCHDVVRPETALFFKSEGRALSAWFVAGSLAALVPEQSLRRWLSPTVVVALVVAWFASCWLGGNRVVGLFAITGIVMWVGWVVPARAVEDRLGGDYSYGLYIYGYPVQQLLGEFGVAQRGVGVFFWLSLLVTFGFAVASWHLIEKRALRLKSFRVSPLTTISGA